MGIQLAGMPGRWFTAPAVPVQDALLREGHAPEDAALDIGDSAVIECVGLGGMALAAAPAVAAFFGGGAAARGAAHRADGADLRRALGALHDHEPRLRRHAGRDRRAARRASSGITPQITTGVLHASAGAGQIGAGVAHQPVEPFRAALGALAAALEEQPAPARLPRPSPLARAGRCGPAPGAARARRRAPGRVEIALRRAATCGSGWTGCTWPARAPRAAR